MKYIVILGDGMGDLPLDELNGQTPLDVAKIPTIDFLAQNGMVGLAHNVPQNLPAGSDTANLGVIGYNPQKYYTGRSPLEAASMGIDLTLSDVTYRCNLVTLSQENDIADATMIDYSAGEITTEEAAQLIHFLNEKFQDETRNLYAGMGYRHCLVHHNGEKGVIATPPHNITDKPVKEYLPHEGYGDELLNMMRLSYEILKDHPINQDRIKRGLNPANSCWFWGEGNKPALTSFKELYQLDGTVISAVDLIKGIGICAGLDAPNIEGATATIDTNYANKVSAALKALETQDFVYVHIEAPDEAGHHGNIQEKIDAIEILDQQVVAPIVKAMQEKNEDFSIFLTPDHPTPIVYKTHTHAAVPFIIYRSNQAGSHPAPHYSERHAEATGVFYPEGYQLMQLFLEKE